MDTLHFSEKISENIMNWIHVGKGKITKENYLTYYSQVEKLYTDFEFDYASADE